MISLAMELMNIPIAYDVDISEDCLILDVYTPSLSGKRPVMVFIHGGGLSIGRTDTRAFL